MKFKNKEEYMTLRNDLLAEADALLADGKMEETNAKMEEVKSLDNSYEAFAETKANMDALKDVVPVANVISNNAVAGIIDSTADKFDNEREYRIAFMNYVLKGEPISDELKNTAAYTTTSDVGAVIPNTILDKIVEKMETVGTVLNQVTRTFFKGGVTVPTSSAKPTATWATERGKVDSQKKSVGSVVFTYNKLKVVIACSLTVEEVTLDVFERTIEKNIADAMVKAIEDAIFNGTGSGQPKGILTETAAANIDLKKSESFTLKTLTSAEAAVPDEYAAEWYISKATFMDQIVGMTDSNGQPIARVNFGVAGKPEYFIFGRKVNLVSYIADYEAAPSDDTIVACIFDMSQYMLNTNMDVTVTKYEDHDTDDQMTKAVMLVDGKAVDLASLVTITKKNA